MNNSIFLETEGKKTKIKKLEILANENPLPESFNCSQCHKKCEAECCAFVPIPIALIKRNAEKMQCAVLEFKKIDEKTVIPITGSKKCPFLKSDYSCAVYKWRPPICRLFGTEIHENLTCRFQDRNGNIRKL